MENSNNYEKIKEFLEQGIELGLELKDILKKLEDSHKAAKDEILRIVLLGSFSDGKTSAVAGLLGKLSENMKIDVAESSDELEVYRPDGLKEGYEIVDTPGLFGTKEKEIDGTNIKYSAITEKYISEAHIIIYVCDAVVPLKDSHKESLRLVLRKFNKLSSTIFVLNKMDEAGYDLTDEEDYQAGMKIKTATLKRRLKETIGLTIEEENLLKIVCIAADPKGKGLAHWFEKMDNYKRRSRIETLRNEVNQIVQLKDKNELKSAVDFAVLQDIMMGVSKQITITNQALREPLDKCKEITKDMKNDCQILKQELMSNKRSMENLLEELRIDVKKDISNASDMNQLASVIEDIIGIEGDQVTCHILSRKINQIISECAESNQMKLEHTAVTFENKFNLQDEILKEGMAKSAKFLQKVKIDNTHILKARDLLAKNFKFKPWQATKWAKHITKGLKIGGLILAVFMEAWEWWKAKKNQEKLEKLQNDLKDAIESIFKNLFDLFNKDEDYYKNFAPSYPELCKQIKEREVQLLKMEGQNNNLREYKSKIKTMFSIDAEDVGYEEI